MKKQSSAQASSSSKSGAKNVLLLAGPNRGTHVVVAVCCVNSVGSSKAWSPAATSC
jgi:hypothetical protein